MLYPCAKFDEIQENTQQISEGYKPINSISNLLINWCKLRWHKHISGNRRCINTTRNAKSENRFATTRLHCELQSIWTRRVISLIFHEVVFHWRIIPLSKNSSIALIYFYISMFLFADSYQNCAFCAFNSSSSWMPRSWSSTVKNKNKNLHLLESIDSVSYLNNTIIHLCPNCFNLTHLLCTQNSN